MRGWRGRLIALRLERRKTRAVLNLGGQGSGRVRGRANELAGKGKRKRESIIDILPAVAQIRSIVVGRDSKQSL